MVKPLGAGICFVFLSIFLPSLAQCWLQLVSWSVCESSLELPLQSEHTQHCPQEAMRVVVLAALSVTGKQRAAKCVLVFSFHIFSCLFFSQCTDYIDSFLKAVTTLHSRNKLELVVMNYH